MVNEDTLIFSEPSEHGLEYCSCIAEEIVEASGTDLNAVEFDGTLDGNRTHLRDDDPISYWGVGHGNTNIYTVECMTPFLNGRSGENLDLMRDRVVHLCSCYTGQGLGPALIDNDSEAYVGYTSAFVYGCWTGGASRPSPCDPPQPRADFYSFGRSDVELQAHLLNGEAVGDSVDASQDKFEEYIRKYETGEWSDRPVAPYAARYLNGDKNSQTPLGNMGAKPKTPTAPPIVQSAAGGVLAAGLTTGLADQQFPEMDTKEKLAVGVATGGLIAWLLKKRL